jgi:phosphatidyl-myo-inositol dimannoside synthase
MQMPKHQILFLTLRVFSATGGIEKVCRLAGKAIQEFSSVPESNTIKILSLYDESADVNELYFPATVFSGFGKHRLKFLKAVLKEAQNSRLVILSHINLLILGYVIKTIAPKTKLVLFAHGIEVWSKLPQWKKRMLHKCDHILPVSNFTKNKMAQLYQLPESKFTILNNCLDPFLPTIQEPCNKDEKLLARYGIGATDKVLLTLTRLASRERYKGYELVMQAVHDIKAQYPSIKYLVVGKYDLAEKQRLDNLINRLSLQENIILAGFIPDEELAAHYSLADLYIMPSRKEGFGIVFIEAMFYGKPVIAGNADGSVDALKNGKFGVLVNPLNQQQITDAIVEVISNKEKFLPAHKEVMNHFGFSVYKEKLKNIVEKI